MRKSHLPVLYFMVDMVLLHDYTVCTPPWCTPTVLLGSMRACREVEKKSPFNVCHIPHAGYMLLHTSLHRVKLWAPLFVQAQGRYRCL